MGPWNKGPLQVERNWMNQCQFSQIKENNKFDMCIHIHALKKMTTSIESTFKKAVYQSNTLN